MSWKVPKLWAGETAVILGGGPSLTEAQVKSAQRFRRIATNMAFLLDPQADMLCWGDSFWYLNYWKRLQEHTGELKVTWRHCPKFFGVPDFHVVSYNKGRSFSLDPCLVGGSNTGHGAINIAFHLGVSRVILVGFDMTPEHGDNWHQHYGDQRHASQERYDIFVREMEQTAEILADQGVDVVNCSTNTVLTCFRRARIEDL